MHIFRIIPFLLGILLWTGCSNVRLALYDYQKRQEYAKETKEAFSNSDVGKEMALKRSIISTAREYLGTRYKYGSTDPKQGFDCSGLVYHVAKKHQIELPRSSGSLAASAPHIAWKKAKPGDLVFFGERGRIDHVGIIEKNTNNELWVIHSTIKKGVYHENVLVSTYWKKRVLFAVDFNSFQPKKSKGKS
jgi:cell wall-associated NlpC family hydrolase